jgi:hypothetical protein
VSDSSGERAVAAYFYRVRSQGRTFWGTFFLADDGKVADINFYLD